MCKILFIFGLIMVNVYISLRKFDSNNTIIMCRDEKKSVSVNRVKKKLIWSDEFNYLDKQKWTAMITGWRGDNAFQYYTDRAENIFVQNGTLGIKPTFTADRFGVDFLYNGTLDLWKEGCNANWGGGCIVKAGQDIIQPIQSARIHTKNSFSFTYGLVETRVRMPKGDWIWPAVWMSPTWSIYGSNPRSGEIDITEVRCNKNLTCGERQYGRQLSGSTLHWGPDHQHNMHRLTHWEKSNRSLDFSSDYHIFAVEWSPTEFKFFVDTELIGGISPPAGGFWELGKFEGENIWADGTVMAPFDQPFHLIIDVAVGGNMFPDWCTNQPYDKPIDKPWSMSDQAQMRNFWEKREGWYPTWDSVNGGNVMTVDYVRVYSLE